MAFDEAMHHHLFLVFCAHYPHVSEVDRWEMAGDATKSICYLYNVSRKESDIMATMDTKPIRRDNFYDDSIIVETKHGGEPKKP
jgi:hypothetical protein